MTRGARIALAAALGLAVLAVAWGAGRRLARAEERWVEVRREPFVRRLPASGELESADAVIVGCPQIPGMWEFTITSIVDEGVFVDEGDPLLSFDGRRISERLEVKRSELDTSRRELDRTRLELADQIDARRLEVAEARAEKARIERQLDVPAHLAAGLETEKLRLDARLAATRLELATRAVELARRLAAMRLESAERAVAELEREVDRLEKGLARLRVVAERPGYVVHIPDWRGDKPQVGQSVWRGRPLSELADLSRMQVAAEIAEADARWVREGQRAEVRLDAAPERLFTGRVRRLGRLFRTRSRDDPSKVLDAIVDLDEPDPELMRPGMAVSLEILAPTPEPVIEIPEAALNRVDGRDTVTVRRRGHAGAESVTVTLAGRWRGTVLVASGLEPGDRVRVATRREAGDGAR
ncbi:MAG: hypothetical protein Kow0062_18990 [Acidobacteriota bacterium]